MPRTTKETAARRTKTLIEQQDRRCPVCDIERPHKNKNGHLVRKYEDKLTGLILCASCAFMVNYIRRHAGPRLNRAVRLVETGEV